MKAKGLCFSCWRVCLRLAKEEAKLPNINEYFELPKNIQEKYKKECIVIGSIQVCKDCLLTYLKQFDV